MTWENYAIDIGSRYYLTKHYWQLKLLKFLDATFKKQCIDRDPNYRYKHSRKDMYSIWCYR